MATSDSPTRSASGGVRTAGWRIATVTAVIAVVVPATAGAAYASGGTSGRTNNCYSTWGNTGSSAHCLPATATGYYQNHLVCNGEGDKVSNWVLISNGATVDNWGQLNCRFKASSADVRYRGSR
ncbi:hypothetical protein ACWT_3852 [Actinoplanes sp. SE50]|uniref:hypothetical protein n=1 Tax=unclassified Actinoplanes TaxID=2626549 RepID=UPI00023ECEAC|nr:MULTISPECIES: hypothetical protein [unclassified Actinoplanes]AEV84876.1 hypothetical protein ACPL_3981 [Actinoplanes sp. SE50/110]ATO83267.1 hypothetical protein ACWT_3852 [Actinoplanes sp. SE50]SLM00674.1 hypothetical protein ACSP50_3907 [Actinoplanes sp. SE50/110]